MTFEKEKNIECLKYIDNIFTEIKKNVPSTSIMNSGTIQNDVLVQFFDILGEEDFEKVHLDISKTTDQVMEGYFEKKALASLQE